MSEQKKIMLRAERRKFRVKNCCKSKTGRLRVSIFRSLKHIYAQIIDDSKHATILSHSSLLLKEKKGDKKEVARLVGIQLGKKAIDGLIKEVFFDRGANRYSGRVKALIEGLREGGLCF